MIIMVPEIGPNASPMKGMSESTTSITGKHALYAAAGLPRRDATSAMAEATAVDANRGAAMETSPTICSEDDPKTDVCKIPTTPTSANRHQ